MADTKIVFALVIIITIFISNHCYGATEILNVRHWAAPDHTRIVLDVEGDLLYDVQETEKRLLLNFKDAAFNKSIPAENVIHKPGIRKVVFHRLDEDKRQIEFILDDHQKVEVFKLKKFQDRPDRIVVDIILEQIPKEEVKVEKIDVTRRKKIIVLDPGHGGEDPGAIGKRGTYEKNIVLSIAREIKKTINKIPGYRSVLTRDGDYYVSFNKRLQKAKDLNASLFISVHADAARNRIAKGSSVYCLSTGGASNEAAKLLANNENLSDILGGVPENEGNHESSQIIMNMFQTNTINSSKIYAGILMNHLDMVNCLKYNNVQEAPFRVLKLPDIPAVLIETAFISNPQEEDLLKKTSFQKTLATSIASSIREYLSETGVPYENDKIPTISYQVQRGDTLFSLAGRFNTKVETLLRLNNLKLEDPLFVNQKILVPADKKSSEEKNVATAERKKIKPDISRRKPKFYAVKKGDTLCLVARKNSIPLQELLKINKMKITDPLLYGQRIKLP